MLAEHVRELHVLARRERVRRLAEEQPRQPSLHEPERAKIVDLEQPLDEEIVREIGHVQAAGVVDERSIREEAQVRHGPRPG